MPAGGLTGTFLGITSFAWQEDHCEQALEPTSYVPVSLAFRVHANTYSRRDDSVRRDGGQSGAKAWCLLTHAEASLSLDFSRGERERILRERCFHVYKEAPGSEMERRFLAYEEAPARVSPWPPCVSLHMTIRLSI